MKVLYVRNLTSDVTEEMLKEKFGAYGKVERVKKIKDYGFIHFEDRDDAVKAMEALNGEVPVFIFIRFFVLPCLIILSYKLLEQIEVFISAQSDRLACYPVIEIC